LLKQLDSPRFTEREQAQKELTLIADLIPPQLQAARTKSSEEALGRIDAILKSVADPTPERLRHVRACEVLEGIGTAEAMKVLKDWASGPKGSRITTEAKESLARLARR
jgi:hypothetical protein